MKWEDLTMREKAELMKTYVWGGYTSLDDIRNHFNSFAEGGPKKTFKQWQGEMGQKYPWLELDSKKAGYDYERYFNENYDDAVARLSETQTRHFTDRYKLPNHPTYSNESVYSEGPRIGGSWNKDNTFSPSVINQQQYPSVYKENRHYTEDEIYSKIKKYAVGGDLDGPDDPPGINPVPIKLPEVEITGQNSDFGESSPYKDYLNSPRRLKRDYIRGVREYLGIPEAIVARVTDSFNKNYYTDKNKEILKSLENASGFFNAYLNSPFYKEKYSSQNIDPEQMQYSFPKLRVTQTNVNGPGHRTRKIGKNVIDMPLHYAYDQYTNIDNQQDEVLVHEIAHENPLFNTGNSLGMINVESPYYGMNYSGIPESWKEVLTPEDWWDLDFHDQELNENYSDLQALRYLLYKEGIWNVLDHDKPFGEEELDKLMHLDNYSIPVERFLQNHNTNQIIKAINEVAQGEDNKEILPTT